MDVMEKFATRKYLRRKTRLDYFTLGDWPVLHLEEPAVLARFAAELKQKGGAKRSESFNVFARGQTEHHGRMPPSLFRCGDGVPEGSLRNGEVTVAAHIRETYPMKRFQRSHLTALLQHYGLKTSWLDVVDNLWIAVWFATHDLISSRSGHRYRAVRSPEEYGWIYFIETENGRGKLESVDIRRHHQGLSVRPHVQHGVSLRHPTLKDLTPFVAATVRFPNDFRWVLAGYLFDAGVLFPPRRFDHTLDKLATEALRTATGEIEEKHGLEAESLGRVFEVAAAAT